MQKQLLTVVSILFLTACTTTSSPVSKPVETTPTSNPPPPQAKPAENGQSQPQPQVNESPIPASAPISRYSVNPNNYQITSASKTEKNILLLTIDDGPTGASTTEILQILDRHQAKAIWFVNGHQIADKKTDGTFVIKPDKAKLLKEIKQKGHLIGNHTWWHENLRQLTPEKQREEIISTSDVIEQITGERPAYFRPPFGAYTPVSKQVCQEQGMLSMNWSVGSLDWIPKVYKQPNAITQQVLATVHEGGNILFHDRTWTARELDAILSQLKKNQYKFVLPTER